MTLISVLRMLVLFAATFSDQEKAKTIEFHPRSPDLTPLDFFLWAHLKSVVYAKKQADLPQLKQLIRDENRAITPEMLKKVMNQMFERLHSIGRNRSELRGDPPTLSPIALLSRKNDKHCRKWPENAKKC
jgi:hypothetical protein